VSVPDKSLSNAIIPENERVWDYKFHPAAEIFPMMSDAEIEHLADDIKKNGLQVALVLCHNQILDGRNRFKACKKAGVRPRFLEYGGDDPLNAVFSMNAERRHMSQSQKAMFAVKIATMKLGENRGAHRKKEGSAKLPTLPADNVSQTEAAKKCSVSERLLRDAKTVMEKAPKESIQEILEGKRSINSVLKKIKAKNEGAQTSTPTVGKQTKTKGRHLSLHDKKGIAAVITRIADEIRSLKQYGLENLRKDHMEALNDIAAELTKIIDPKCKKVA